ncbi:3%2C4-dihydroxy-2-butanone 4-phosphate synthase [Bordetella pertussis]|nr:3%2C4-dihydroxy-2-butanone 4-phosphate synthase [Bordetella pertussis]
MGRMKLLARQMPSMAGFALTITGYDCVPPNLRND